MSPSPPKAETPHDHTSDGKRNPPWERDELILALDLYFDVPYSKVSERHPKVVDLSALLNALPLHSERTEKFRNPNGVAMKLGNFARLDPAYTHDGKKGLSAGGSRNREVWFEFATDRERLKRVAEVIRILHDSTDAVAPPVPDEDEEEFAEGRVLYRLHRSRERNGKVVDEAKRRAFRSAGTLVCAVCAFDFEVAYGDLGQGFIEAHHIRPISELLAESKTRPSDLALVCANCHRMLHRRRPWLSASELKQILHS